MKLTPQQEKALKSLALRGHPKSSYGIGVSLATMEALRDRGFICSVPGPGWTFSPQTCEWKITAKGLGVAGFIIAKEQSK
jgi:hypothetical protein